MVARTGQDERGARLSLFIVPTDAAGLEKHLLPVDLLLPERQFTLHFDGVRVGPGALVGAEGEGFKQVFHGLNPERITGAALGVGIARYALTAAARYASDRKVWSEPIGAHQGVAHPLAKAKIETELAALMIRQAAWQHDHGQPAGESSNMAKYAAAEAAIAAVDAAIQAHGGNGLASEYGLMPVLGAGAAAAHRAGQPGDDPQLRRPAQPGPAEIVLGSRVPVLTSHVDPNDETYRANRAAQLAVLDELGKQLELAIAGGGERYQQRHRDRGRLLARERIELLVDPDSPFLELAALAAWGTGFTVGASVVTGIGVISGVECVIIAHDPTVRGGAMNPYSLRKILRALEIARVNRLPVVNLVESGGADLPTQADLFVPAGRIFHDLTELSAYAVPTVALVFGNSTAGGAYVPGMCDYAVLVDGQAKVFLGGPPLVKMATGEESDDESLGGAEMHSRVSGLSDYFAVDEHDAIRIGRDIMARINWRKQGPPPGRPCRPGTTRTRSSASSPPT